MKILFNPKYNFNHHLLYLHKKHHESAHPYNTSPLVFCHFTSITCLYKQVPGLCLSCQILACTVQGKSAKSDHRTDPESEKKTCSYPDNAAAGNRQSITLCTLHVPGLCGNAACSRNYLWGRPSHAYHIPCNISMGNTNIGKGTGSAPERHEIIGIERYLIFYPFPTTYQDFFRT